MLRALLLAALLPLPAAAQSAFGCSDLDQGRYASVEGANGAFFRIDPELHMFQPFADATADAVADLSRALAAGGTTLVYVPVPTRALAMPEALPPAARDLGFDPAVAGALYDDLVRRLAERGVLAVDARAALRARPGEAPSFLAADPRMTADGARRMATAVAAALDGLPALAPLPRARFETRPTGPATLASPMRDALQRRCIDPLPAVAMDGFATSRLDAPAASDSLFDSQAEAARVVLVGTEVTAEPAANLPGYLAERTGLAVAHYAVSGGGAFAAISSVLTSREFQGARPAVLVWMNPIDRGLAVQGDQALRELVAAAGPPCRAPLPVARGADPSVLIADLSGLAPDGRSTLLVDADGAPARAARFDFTGPDGLVRSRWVDRDPGQAPTGRFFMPLTGLWAEGARSVAVTLDAPVGPDARMAACLG